MPKRVVDGDALWSSAKLSQVEPLAYRAEYANLIPLALANGSFEADPRLVWKTVYAYNRPDITPDVVREILAEFERVGILFRWRDERGVVWGFWINIDKPGRLPGESRRGKNEGVGAPPPMDSIRKFLDSICIQGELTPPGAEPRTTPDIPVIPTPSNGCNLLPSGNDLLPDGNKKLLGFGSGLGKGLGSGGSNPPSFPNKNPEQEDGQDAFNHAVAIFPVNRASYSANTQTLYFQAISELRGSGLSDSEAVAKMDRAITAYVAKEGEFCFGFERFLRDGVWKGYLARISSSNTPSLAEQDARNQARLKAVSGMNDEEYGKHRQEILRKRRGE